ncbi:MAG: UDP-N-acetylglucosamine--N-acetylmuramyl-(pentapeptide) pyrophosphoryl-undecaprenol N-acetylglucosamine transferase [Gemmatimonadales bacterium]|nr:UDP-N-acetylglucosamine--N-acetylmuramyl-(pentapeptide) pyrophosphoryl-undecaprenol N-acetylglucosamine transferase [bacterium HR33]GIW51304.1 MAG: UDP-N-acetylglucosamine--N-acetylmuramyl-(pentapeptide) pyrophosphoryl-undecaprenol N-acetylglucosamine transferase [Gemmatimonadales bacterium]
MPALAIAQALRDLNPEVMPVLVGAKRGVEASILPERPFPYYLLPAEPLYRKQWWKNLRWPILALRLWKECRQILELESPKVVVGTGGYASGPVLFVASRRGIPIVLQEQNAYPGLTTRYFAGRAVQIHLGLPEASRYLPARVGDRLRYSGNPIAPPPAGLDRTSARSRLGLPDSIPAILVFGGSQGARVLNRTVREMLEGGMLENIALLWGTGRLEWERYRHFHDPPLRQVRAFWDPIAVPYRAADLAVTRAGAMTTAELCAFGLPSILVPLKRAAADHQTKNAQALEACGAAFHLPEDRLRARELVRLVQSILRDAELANRMKSAALSRAKPDAARSIASAILDVLS